ncbi:hypothetical protein DTO169E5_6123 [Paecilomyces variotii]|nr:hypothetical protein DTO169E5_6123 [Paecilomyces variotii]
MASILPRSSTTPELSSSQVLISDSHYDPTYGLLPSHHFQNHRRFTRFLEDSFKNFERDNNQQYAMVGGVTEKIIDWLDANHRRLPRMRLCYDDPTGKLIIKFVSRRHERLHTQLMFIIYEQLRNMGLEFNEFVVEGAGRQQGNNSRQKEPDNSFCPTNTRPNKDDLSTLIIEAGLSEGLNQLRNDAHFWLTQTNERVKIVILVHGSVAQKKITIERWQNVSSPRPQRTKSATVANRPTRIQQLTITKPNNSRPIVTNAPLILPLSKIFDTKPSRITQDEISLPDSVLEQYAGAFFLTLP